MQRVCMEEQTDADVYSSGFTGWRVYRGWGSVVEGAGGGEGVIQPLNPPNIHPVVKYSGKNERGAACWPSDVFRYVES